MSKKITLNQLIEELADEALIPKSKSQEFINSLLDVTLDEINTKGKSAITNFGSFTVVEVAERTGVNPKTGDPLIIPAHKRLSFTPYKALEKKVNRDFDHLEAKVVDPNQPEEVPPAAEEKEIELTESPVIEDSKNEAEKLFDALTGDSEPAVSKEESPSEIELEDDPFNFDDNEAEESEEDVSAALELDDLDESSDDDEDPEDEPVQETKAFRTPGRPQRKSTGISPTALLGVFAVIVIGIFAVWFFYLRPDSTTNSTTTSVNDTDNILNDPSAFENEQVLSEVSDANDATQTSATNDPDSQIIPMVAPEVDLSENQGDVMTIQSQEPQIEVERFTGITYSVSNGVWIYEIARQTYGNTRLWPLIFQANYTLANNPDLILPNVDINIPQLEGTTENPSSTDYVRLAEAARYVAQAYENAGNAPQAEAYRSAALWYETMQ